MALNSEHVHKIMNLYSTCILRSKRNYRLVTSHSGCMQLLHGFGRLDVVSDIPYSTYFGLKYYIPFSLSNPFCISGKNMPDAASSDETNTS
jgi:hypothetical protein